MLRNNSEKLNSVFGGMIEDVHYFPLNLFKVPWGKFFLILKSMNPKCFFFTLAAKLVILSPLFMYVFFCCIYVLSPLML